MLTREKHILANRPLFFAFVALIAGILLAFSFVYNLSLLIVLSVITYIAFVLLLVRRKFDTCLIMFVALIIGVLAFVICFSIYKANYIETQTYKVVGKVTDSFIKEDNYSIVTLENCKIYLDDELITSGSVSVFVSGSGGYTYGDVIEFEAVVSTEDFTDFGSPSYSVINGVIYNATISNDDISVLDNNLTIDESVRIAVKERIESYFNPTQAGLAYGLIFGDRQLLDASTTESFQYSGIAHLLAVSGVNVSIMFGLLGALLNRFSKNKVLNLILLAVPVLLFLWLCGFAPSVCRAGLMFLIMYFASAVHRNYDALNNLSLAGIILLLFNPLDLFNVGFLLSFSCILGMILFNDYFIQKLALLKNKFLQISIATCLSTTIMTLPFMCQYFGYFSVFGLLTNFIILPVFEIAFIALMIVVLVGLILPFQFLFDIVGELLATIIYISKAIADIDYSIIYVVPFTMTMSVIFTFTMFLISRKVMIEKRYKKILALGMCVVLVLSGLFGVMKYNNNVSVINTNVQSITIRGDTTSVIGFPSNSQDLSMLNRFNFEALILKVDNIVLVDSTFIKLDRITEFVDKYHVNNIYILESCLDKYDYILEDSNLGDKTSVMLFDTVYDFGYNVVAKSYSKQSFYFEIITDNSSLSIIDSERFRADDLSLLINSLDGHYIIDGESENTKVYKSDSYYYVNLEDVV